MKRSFTKGPGVLFGLCFEPDLSGSKNGSGVLIVCKKPFSWK